jgi:hypothetical protein
VTVVHSFQEMGKAMATPIRFVGSVPAAGEWAVHVQEGGGAMLPLKPGFEHGVRHSPDGFAWGYPGSGPAQLAFAMCLYVLKDADRAKKVYQRFKAGVIAALPMEKEWTMTAQHVLEIVEGLEDGK